MAAKKKSDRQQLEDIKATIANFTPEQHAQFGESVRAYFREHGLELLSVLDECAESDDPDIAEDARAMLELAREALQPDVIEAAVARALQLQAEAAKDREAPRKAAEERLKGLDAEIARLTAAVAMVAISHRS